MDSISASRNEMELSGYYQNGLQGKSLDSSASFRAGNENRSSMTNLSRENAEYKGNMPSVSQLLNLDPLTMGDQNHERLDEIRRILGVSSGTTAYGSSLGPAHGKTSLLVATGELKQFKESVSDASVKASIRAERLDKSLCKLGGFVGALNTEEEQERKVLTNEKPDESNFLKKGALMHRDYPDLLPQRMEKMTKSLFLNKRVRSSLAETKAESRIKIPRRHPPDPVNRDIPDVETSELAEEQNHKISSRGEGWENKVKCKRSIGLISTGTVDCDKELKCTMNHKPSIESGRVSFDSQSYRLGSSNGVLLRSGSSNGTKGSKSDNNFHRDDSNMHGNDLDKDYFSRDFMVGATKEWSKGIYRSKVDGNNHAINSGSLPKGKAWRTPGYDPLMVANCFPEIPCAAADDFEQPPSISKVTSVGGANSRKHTMLATSSSSQMAQWTGQRPKKISRPRRANVVSPVSDLDEGKISSEGCSPSDLAVKVTSVKINGLPAARGVVHENLQYISELASSPLIISESEKRASGKNLETRLQEKGINTSKVEERGITSVQTVSPSSYLLKNKLLKQEEIVGGVRRRGRSSRGSSKSRVGISPLSKKLEKPSSLQCLNSARHDSDRSKSKLGRPSLKKLSERKALTHLGHASISGYPDLSGDLDDDLGELLSAANFACNASYLACSNSFWKKMEAIFASISVEDISYLKQQLVVSDEQREGSPKA